MTLDWYQADGQPAVVESVDATLPDCPHCGSPVHEPGIWVVRGADLCGRDCAAQHGGHL